MHFVDHSVLDAVEQRSRGFVADRAMRSYLVIQRGEGTPTGPKNGRYTTPSILGPDALSTFTR